MPDIAPCILCDSEAESTADEARKVVTWDCPKCRQYTLVADVAAELRKLPNWQELRPKLAKAVPWRFYYQGPGLIVLWNIMDAERLVLYHEQFEKEFAQEHAVAALVGADPSEDPLDTEHMRKLGRAVGLSLDEARAFAKKLEAGNIVRIVDCEAGQADPDIKSFGKLKQWMRCEAAAKGE